MRYETSGAVRSGGLIHHDWGWPIHARLPRREDSYFTGQMLAEKNQDDNWTGYVYANGKKIAKLEEQQPLLHLHMQRTATSCGATVAVGVDLTSLHFAAGDRSTMSVKASGNVQWGAGFMNSDANGTLYGMNLADQDGAGMAALTLQNGVWTQESGDLSPYAPNKIERLQFAIQPAIQPGTQTGPVDVWVKDVTIVHADGMKFDLL